MPALTRLGWWAMRVWWVVSSCVAPVAPVHSPPAKLRERGALDVIGVAGKGEELSQWPEQHVRSVWLRRCCWLS